MNTILVLLRKDFASFRRDRGSVILTFVVPFALIYLFGQIFGVNRADSGPSAIPLGIVDQSGGRGEKLVTALRAAKSFHLVAAADEPAARAAIRNGDYRFAVVLPADFTRPGRFGLHLQLLSDPRNTIEAQTVPALVQRTLYESVPKLLAGDAPEVESASAFYARAVRFESIQVVGRQVKSPMATQLVGGWAMQFLLFALVASATSLFYERDNGIFQRILSGPVPRSAILWSKFIYGTLLGVLQMGVLFGAGKLLFGIELGSNLPELLLVGIFAGAACSAFGMLLASLAKSPEMARGLATFVILMMSALGGAWFPVSFMPAAMQHLSRLTLVYWSIEGFLQVLWAHAPFVQLLPTLGILAGMTALILGVAWWRFAKGTLFD